MITDNVDDSADAFRVNACAFEDTDDDNIPNNINESTATSTFDTMSCDTNESLALIAEILDTATPRDTVVDAQISGCMRNDVSTLLMCADPDDDNDRVLDMGADDTSMFYGMVVSGDTPRDEFPMDASLSCNLDGDNGDSRTDNVDSPVHDCDNDGLNSG